MKLLNRLYSWYGKRNVLISLVVIIALLIVGFFIHLSGNNTAEEVQEEQVSLVRTSRVDALSSASLFRVIGEVKAVSEARLQTESGGRITSVTVELGDSVKAGSVLATLENSAQRASLLQAEGAYDAAVAGAASSESSVETAQTSLESARLSGVNTYKSAFISADSAVRNTIDDLFSDPTGLIPGFRLEAYGTAPTLNAERTALEGVLDAWSLDIASTDVNNVQSRLAAALENVERIARYAETLAQIVARQDTNASFTQTDKDTLEAELLGVRSTLNGTAQSITAAITSLQNSQEALDRAQIASSGSTVSLADAQVKSALGSLRAAQAAYEKTLVRTPITGVVNALYLKEGEYATPGAPAAVVANNGALEITTALSETDAELVTIGQQVLIDQVVSGVVTAIAPAIDPISGKKEVKIGVSDDIELTNGSTVTVEFTRSDAQEEVASVMTLPLSALRITSDGYFAFTLSQDSTLVAHKVQIGKVMGDVVEVTEGLTADTVIVTDVRGLREGEKVEVTAQ